MQVQVGTDVAKEWIDFAASEGRGGRVDNTAPALKAWLGSWPPGVIAMESTGGYHELLATLAQSAGWRVYVLNPAHVKKFREFSGVRAKTDRLDAAVILRFLQQRGEGLRPWSPGTRLQRQILKLVRERAAAVRHFGALLQAMTDRKAQADIRRCSERCVKHFDERIDALVATDEALALARRRLASVPGIGPLTSAALAVLFARVPFQTSDAAVAFLGMDLRADDSGSKTGRRFLTKKGDPEYRRLLYMAGKAAATTKLLKPLYQALKARHSTTEAILILARKLLRIALAVYREGQTFDPTKVGMGARPA